MWETQPQLACTRLGPNDQTSSSLLVVVLKVWLVTCMQLPIALLTHVVDVWHVEFSELCLYFAHALLLEEALQAESFLSWIASLDCLCVACASVVQSPIGDHSQAQPEQTWHLSFICHT